MFKSRMWDFIVYPSSSLSDFRYFCGASLPVFTT